MDNKDKEKIEKIIADRKTAHQFFTDNSEVYRSFIETEIQTYRDGNLSKKHKELIAIGISVHSNCEQGLEWHIKQAIYAGASKEEVLEAIEVGLQMGGGSSSPTARFALQVLDYYIIKNRE